MAQPITESNCCHSDYFALLPILCRFSVAPRSSSVIPASLSCRSNIAFPWLQCPSSVATVSVPCRSSVAGGEIGFKIRYASTKPTPENGAPCFGPCPGSRRPFPIPMGGKTGPFLGSFSDPGFGVNFRSSCSKHYSGDGKRPKNGVGNRPR